MEKLTKGALAIGAGAVLLLGGLGTYALWSVQQDVSDAQITAGDLNLELGDSEGWTLNGTGIVDVEEVLIVPGDVLELEQDLDVTVIGDTLVATLSVTGEGDLTGDPVLLSWLDVDLTVETPLPAEFTDNNDGTYDVVGPDTQETVTVFVTVTFDEDTPDREGTTESVDLSALEFSLDQYLP